MKRDKVIKILIENDLDSIFSDHPERALADMLENGIKGYNAYSDKELEEFYSDMFEGCDKPKKVKITK